MICIILNNTKNKILMDVAFFPLNKSNEYTFLLNRKQLSTICKHFKTKLFKTKTAKHLEACLKNVCVINFKNKVFNKVHVSSIFLCQDIISQLRMPLETAKNIPVPTMKLLKTIRNKILNYKDIFQAISIITILQNKEVLDC